MPKRSLRYRGFGVSVEVPQRIASALRRLRPGHDVSGAGTADRLVVQPAPPIDTDLRLRQRSHWTDFAANASGTHPDNVDEVAGHFWYHTIELEDGSVTPGRFDHRPLVPRYGLPDDLHGKRALDVGSGNGFWAFELERRGANVTSLDIESFADADLPPALHKIFVEHPVNLSFRRGIDIARRRRSSHINLVNMPIYALDPDVVGMFDFVHAGDILLHLRDPALALQRIRSVTAGEFLLADHFDPELDALGAGPGLTRYRGGWEDVTWWAPALSTLTQMVVDAGFADVAVLTTYRLGEEKRDGLWRAVIRARCRG